MLGKIKSIEEVFDFTIGRVSGQSGRGGNLGMAQMVNAIFGHQVMDGYKVETDRHTFHVLIDNGQSCCESWGYFSSEDDLDYFLEAKLIEINLTDKALNKQKFLNSGYYEENGGIQFVDFVTDRGVFQLAVYNSHNGYYGHGILVAKDEDVLLNDIL